MILHSPDMTNCNSQQKFFPPCKSQMSELQGKCDIFSCFLHCPYQIYFQFSSVTQSCPTLCDPMDCSSQASLSITNSKSLLRLTSIESVMPSNHLILCRPLLLPSSVFPKIRVFSSESVLCNRWPKYWSFNFSISPSNEYSRLISFRTDWVDLLTVQGAIKSLLQHLSSKTLMFLVLSFLSCFGIWLSNCCTLIKSQLGICVWV